MLIMPVQEDQKFKATLNYIASLRPAWTKCDHVSNNVLNNKTVGTKCKMKLSYPHLSFEKSSIAGGFRLYSVCVCVWGAGRQHHGAFKASSVVMA